jgi:hypothetical protein
MFMHLVLGLALLAQEPGWQFTDWGMTPDEVVAASGGSAQLVPGDGDGLRPTGELLATGSYAFGQFRFAVEFRFHDGRLSRVDLRPQEGRCPDIERFLQQKYGEDEAYSPARGAWLWRIPADNTWVQYGAGSRDPLDCVVIYGAIEHAGNAGL